MENISVQQMSYNQINHFLNKSSDKNGQISYATVIEIASWTGAYIIRQRHIQNGNISEEEIQLVLGNIGNFCKESFGDDFTQEDFDSVKSKTLTLLQNPTFDADSTEYFKLFYK